MQKDAPKVGILKGKEMSNDKEKDKVKPNGKEKAKEKGPKKWRLTADGRVCRFGSR